MGHNNIDINLINFRNTKGVEKPLEPKTQRSTGTAGSDPSHGPLPRVVRWGAARRRGARPATGALRPLRREDQLVSSSWRGGGLLVVHLIVREGKLSAMGVDCKGAVREGDRPPGPRRTLDGEGADRGVQVVAEHEALGRHRGQRPCRKTNGMDIGGRDRGDRLAPRGSAGSSVSLIVLL